MKPNSPKNIFIKVIQFLNFIVGKLMNLFIKIGKLVILTCKAYNYSMFLYSMQYDKTI